MSIVSIVSIDINGHNRHKPTIMNGHNGHPLCPLDMSIMFIGWTQCVHCFHWTSMDMFHILMMSNGRPLCPSNGHSVSIGWSHCVHCVQWTQWTSFTFQQHFYQQCSWESETKIQGFPVLQEIFGMKNRRGQKHDWIAIFIFTLLKTF